MYKLFIAIDKKLYRLFDEADTIEGLPYYSAMFFCPWKIEKDGEIVEHGELSLQRHPEEPTQGEVN